MARLLKLLDDETADLFIHERKCLGIDLYDEVWEGTYVIPSAPQIDQQRLVSDLLGIITDVLRIHGQGDVYPGANVSDRHDDWKENYRIPNVVVVLPNSHAEQCGTYLFLGPDFLVEIESPGDDTEEKVPFYSMIGVRKLLIIHRDRRTLRLLRHDGTDLVEVKPSALEGKQWLVSKVLPLAFRRTTSKGVARNEVRRTDDQPASWVV